VSAKGRGALAALILLAACVGLPVALAATVGDPLHAWPSLRAGRLSDRDLTSILAAVFYLAWASFVIPAAVELTAATAARLTHRPYRPARLPLLGAQQDLARALVSAALLVLPAARTATAYAAPAPPVAVHDGAHAAPAATAEHRGVAARRYVIPDAGGMRSYWALAEHYLGDGARWRQIWQLNRGRVHDDGTVMDTPRRLCAGWTILIPPADPPGEPAHQPSRQQVSVHPGDTLSGIAARHGIGDWSQLWQTNRGRAEPGGRHLSDPNLLRPGWHLTLPATRRPPHRDTTTATPQRSHRPTRQTAAPTPPGPAVPPPGTTPPSPATRSTDPPGTAPPQHGPPQHQQRRLPAPLEVALAAAATIALLDRARRIAARRRRLAHRPQPPPDELREVEARLRRDARHAHAATPAITLALTLAADVARQIRAVTAGDDGTIDLHLDPPAPPPPAPFTAVTVGWRLPADTAGYSFGADGTDDPCPALVPLGRSADGQLLVNLAATGPVGIAGDPDRVQALLAQLVTALAAAPWSGRVQLHVPPPLADLLGPLERLTVDDPHHPQPPPAATRDIPGEAAGERTAPVYLYCGWPDSADIAGLLDAATDPRRSVHAVLIGAHPDTATWTLHGEELTAGSLPPVTVSLPGDATAASALIQHTVTAPDLPLGDPRLPDLTADAPPTPDLSMPVPAAATIHAADDDVDPPIDPVTDPATDPTRARLLLLGPVELTGGGEVRGRQALDLLTFLALHRRGVDRHQISAALWPEHDRPWQTGRNLLARTRALVGGAITDGPVWRLQDAVTTDWQEFTALAAGGPDQQRQALALVRGRPFAGLDDADWIDLEGFRSEVEAAIVDTAITVAERDLAAGEFAAALDAARVGLAASRYEERLHRLAISAADAQGRTALADTLEREMCKTLDLDVEPDDQIQPETLALIRARRDRHRRRRRDTATTSRH
jgi:nucleoid-associated protein YgaU